MLLVFMGLLNMVGPGPTPTETPRTGFPPVEDEGGRYREDYHEGEEVNKKERKLREERLKEEIMKRLQDEDFIILLSQWIANNN